MKGFEIKMRCWHHNKSRQTEVECKALVVATSSMAEKEKNDEAKEKTRRLFGRRQEAGGMGFCDQMWKNAEHERNLKSQKSRISHRKNVSVYGVTCHHQCKLEDKKQKEKEGRQGGGIAQKPPVFF